MIKHQYTFLKLKHFIRTFSTDKEALTKYQISIKYSGSLYERGRKEKSFNFRDSHLTFNVIYYDTNSLNTRNTKKTVVSLHGAPGSCHDFKCLTEFLYRKEIRAITPTFPDFSVYGPSIFRHSDEEKAQYIKAFLKALSITKVDCLVCHSSSIYPGLLLCLQQKPIIKSLVMLNTPSFDLTIPAVQPFKGLKCVVQASEYPIGLSIIKVLLPMGLKLIRSPVKYENILDPLLSATVMVNGNMLQSKEKFSHLSTSGFPILYAFSEDDKLIGRNSGYELSYFLGAKPEDICYINKNGVIEKQGNETSVSKFMAFENGSHYVFWKYADIINEAILNFVQKIP